MGMGGAARGAGTIPGTQFGGATDPSFVEVREGFQVIPSVSVGQRYDSNVFFSPKRQGLDREDFVTTAVPQLRGTYVGDSFMVNATAGATGEYYAKNTTLNYVGANTGIVLDLRKLVDRWWQGAALTVSDTYIYTPQAPAFLIGNLSGSQTNPFATGYQVGRANVSSNIFAANLSMPLNQTVSLIGSYSNGFLRFGQSQVQQSGVLLSYKYQTYSAGLSMQVSPQDSLSVNAVYTENIYTSGSGGSFTSQGGNVEWGHTFTPFLTLKSSAGATALKREFPGSSSATTVAPAGNLALLWKDQTTSMALTYGAALTPATQFQASALLTQVVSFALTQQTAIPELLAVASLNYGRGDPYGSSSGTAISYASVGGTGGVVYKFSPQTFFGLNYSYGNVENQFGNNTFAWDRQVVQMSLSHAFY